MMTPQQKELPPKPYYLRPNPMQEKMNEFMVQLVPELAADCCQMPMLESRWYDPSETIRIDQYDDIPCFIPAAENKNGLPRKENYIWMPRRKDLPAGYYHMRTQEAYIQVNHLLRKRRPKQPLFFRKKTDEHMLYAKIKDVMYNRLLSDKPDDLYAARMKLLWIQSAGGRAAALGKAAYLPTLTTTVLMGWAAGAAGS